MSFSDETLVSALREYNRETARSFQKLHSFYRGRLVNLAYSRAEEVVRARPDPLDVCKEITRIFSRFDLATESALEMSSYMGSQPKRYSSRSMKQERTNLNTKSSKVRKNIRRYLNIPPAEDIVEEEFISRKVGKKKSFIVMETKAGRKITAYDSAQHHKGIRRKKFFLISNLVIRSAIDILSYKGFFITLTLPRKFHISSYETANKELQKRWEKITKGFRDQGIIVLGMKKIHLHKDETPHLHIIAYIHPDYEQAVRQIVFENFINDKHREEEAFKEIEDHEAALAYLLRDFCRDDDDVTYCDFRFLGLRKGFLGFWDEFYKGNFDSSKLSGLSHEDLSKAKRILWDTKRRGDALFLLRAFQNESVNELSQWHVNSEHPDLTDAKERSEPFEYSTRNDRCHSLAHKRRRTSLVNPEKWQISKVFRNLVEGNQEGAIHTFSHLRECVDRRFLRTRAELALCRARPPPKPSDTNDRFRIISGEREVLRRPV
ncbi:replication endonuclease [Gluconobacter albidus]|uniref:replication endonuclease n=1 Tax=Gluconobacter albidus TaxID=318683 RepID=UPI001B8D5BCF|nr:replication endonuclease [Gluconobacter albidus]MBS1026849.1 replication endonuclease [Gluconobacter albidus]